MASSPRIRPPLALVRSVERAPSSPPEAKTSPEPPTPALDDSELVRAILDGDSGAAASLHDRLRPRIEGTVRRLLGPRDVDIEDLVQLSMIQIVESIGRFRGDCPLDGWAASIAAHVVYKHIRRRRTERRLFSGFGEDTLAPSSSTGRQITARSLLRRVLEHLGVVDEDKAYAFVLHDVCGFDLKEIAEITSATVSAAQTRLVRGRRELHDRIAGDPDLAGILDDMEDRS